MAMSLNGDLSYGTLLSDSLQRLQENSHDTPADVSDTDIIPQIPSPTSRLLSSVLHEGYGFRPASGASTPPQIVGSGVDSPLPDRNGLGWPGEVFT
jgi:GTP cyclohydrolase I